MKKRLFAIVVLCALVVVCLCACNGIDYKKLNKIVQGSYAEVNLTVETTIDGDTLTSTFKAKNEGNKSTVDYKIERFEPFVGPNIPLERKEILVGMVVVEDGKVTNAQGDIVDGVDFANVASQGITFKKAYFQNAKMTDEQFSADVVRPGMFLGTSLSCRNMKVVVTFGETPKMEVTYLSANNATVKLSYEFIGAR